MTQHHALWASGGTRRVDNNSDLLGGILVNFLGNGVLIKLSDFYLTYSSKRLDVSIPATCMSICLR